MTEKIIDAYNEDISYRIQGLEPANENGWKVKVEEIDGGLIYADDRVQVTAFKINHGTWEHAFGYKFVTPDKTIVVSGDKAASKKLIEMTRGADILVHEVYSQAGFDQRTEVWKKYHASHHRQDDFSLPSRTLRELEHEYLRLMWQSFQQQRDRKSTRLNSSHWLTSDAVFCLKEKL